MNDITVRGARVHNLADVDVRIPRDRLVVVTGPSGSGKSSLAFDTIYAEAQRRYVESLTVYSRQFLERMPKPDADAIDGLPPAIAMRANTASRSPRSTVGTITEILDYLRLLYARVGLPHCPRCGASIRAETVAAMVDATLAVGDGTRFEVLAPVLASGSTRDVEERVAALRRDGFVRVRLDGEVLDLADEVPRSRRADRRLDVVVDRLAVRDGARSRLHEAFELALKLAASRAVVRLESGELRVHSERPVCWACEITLPSLEPAMFSFNSPAGACPACAGLGTERAIDRARIAPDLGRTLTEGALAAFGPPGGAAHRRVVRLLAKAGFDVDKALAEWTPVDLDALFDGDVARGFVGVEALLEARVVASQEAGDEDADPTSTPYTAERLCRECRGTRLSPEARAVTFAGRTLPELLASTVDDALAELGAARATPAKGHASTARDDVAAPLLEEVRARLSFLQRIGVGYLSLDRRSDSLSGGELQRVRLATQLGAGLVGVLYVLDEPSSGLHPDDTARLLASLEALRDRGNTVLLVEHDDDIVRAADFVVDVGPAAGKRGGRVLVQGSVAELIACRESLTGAYLDGRLRIERVGRRGAPSTAIALREVAVHNLARVDVDIPRAALTAVTGVSGSGKSSLVLDALVPLVRARLARTAEPLALGRLDGELGIQALVVVDDAPLGRTSRSSAASYTGLLDILRDLYASTPEARLRGYGRARFSFNVRGGRCEACRGEGTARVEMQFLPDVFVECEQCRGKRFDRETLEVKYKGLHIAEMLGLAVDDALALLEPVPRARAKLSALHAVGLGYLEIGRSAATLSAGEAQRVKLARELARRTTGSTLYVLDEPTRGLHAADVDLLVRALSALIDEGHTVIVVEHHLGLVAVADHVIDLGPGAGRDGGRIVACGTPRRLAREPSSRTGAHLARLFDRAAPHAV